MRILFLCHRLPYPPNEGGRIRAFNMISHLNQEHSVVVASLAHTNLEYLQGAPLTNHCDEVICEVVPASIRWMHASQSLLTKRPSSVGYFWSERLFERIRK